MDFPGHPYSDPLEIALRRELQQGERVAWKGRPIARVQYAAFWLYLFAFPWTSFSIFWTAMAYAGVDAGPMKGAGFLAYAFPLFGLPFILVGLGMMAVPFLPLINAKKTLYALTHQRIIEMRLNRSHLTSRSVNVARLGRIERLEMKDGSGMLKIEIGQKVDSDGDQVTDYLGIGQVAQVKAVETTIRQILDQLKQRVPISS